MSIRCDNEFVWKLLSVILHLMADSIHISYFVRLVNCLNVINTWDWYDYSAIPIIFFTLLMTYFWISFSKGTRAWEKKIALHCIWKVHCLVVPSNTYVRLCMIKKTLSCQKFDTKNLFNLKPSLKSRPFTLEYGAFLYCKVYYYLSHTRQVRWQCAFSKTTKWILFDFTIDSGKSLTYVGLNQVVKDYSNLVWAPRNPVALLPFI